MSITDRIAQTAAALAGLSLIISAFAISEAVHAQSSSAQATTSAMFTRDLTIGSTGADVTALQTWLIGKGFAIAAGATGYFGAQTQAALASYQAANGISPAAGYFGPITRAKVNTPMPAPTPAPSDDDEDEDEDEDEDMNEEDEAVDAIDDARESLNDARDEVEDADDDGDDIGDAEDLLDEAEDTLDDADDALDDEDFDEAMDLADEAEDLIDEALDDIDSNNDDNDDDDEENVTTSAKVTRSNGADNDVATFKIEVNLKPFNQDAYISDDASVSFEYEIQDSDGGAVAGQTFIDTSVDSSADEDGDYFVIEEDESESIELTVLFDPLAVDEGQLYRLQLLGINYADSDTAPDETWDARPESKYRTKSVLIAD